MVVAPNWDAFVAIVIPNVIAFGSAFATVGQISNKDGTAWYQRLKMPSWNLPVFVFGPYFAYMYSSLGYASYLVYAESSGFEDKNFFFPTTLYGGHLILSLTTAFTFYKFHKIAFAFILTLFLDALLLAITISFYQINYYSTIFLLPLQAWQLYVTLLLHAIWVLNTKQVEDYQNLKI